MTEPIFELKDIVVTVNHGTPEQINIMDHVNLAIYPGDFVTILGQTAPESRRYLTSSAAIFPFQKAKFYLMAKTLLICPWNIAPAS